MIIKKVLLALGMASALTISVLAAPPVHRAPSNSWEWLSSNSTSSDFIDLKNMTYLGQGDTGTAYVKTVSGADYVLKLYAVDFSKKTIQLVSVRQYKKGVAGDIVPAEEKARPIMQGTEDEAIAEHVANQFQRPALYPKGKWIAPDEPTVAENQAAGTAVLIPQKDIINWQVVCANSNEEVSINPNARYDMNAKTCDVVVMYKTFYTIRTVYAECNFDTGCIYEYGKANMAMPPEENTADFYIYQAAHQLYTAHMK